MKTGARRYAASCAALAVLASVGLAILSCAPGSTSPAGTAAQATAPAGALGPGTPAPAPTSDAAASKPGATGKTGPFKIALLAQGPTNGWATQFDAVARAHASRPENGIGRLIYFDSRASADKQIKDFEDAMAQRPDAVVLVPMGKAALAGPTERAEAQGVPVILCASGVDTERYHTLVTRDLMAAGQENGEWLARKLGGKGNVIIVDGIAGNDTSETLGKAIRTVLEKYPDIRVVNQGYSDFSVTKAKQLTESVIASGVQIDGAWGSGGEAVTGIMQAFVDANKPVPPVAGGTAQNGALRIAREQKSEYAGWQFPAAISKACLEVAVRTLGGESLPKFIDVIDLLPEARNFYTEDIDRYYRPEYSDDYVAGSDQYLSREDLAALNLIR